ncbi:MAG: uroporphyrinogen decarboxylase family protein [Chloroflexota bacterium]
MSQLSKRERVEAALKGEAVDRVPVSAWRHFIAEERQAASLAQVSLKHFADFDWDWLKVNPRATYYAEAWGNRYDFNHYDSVLPELIDGPLNEPADLEKIQSINPTAGVFAEQLDLVRLVKAGIGDAHFLQTVFSPLSVLGFLVARSANHKIEDVVQAQYDGLHRYFRENPQGVHAALQHITETLAKYAAATVDSGASGLFFAIVKLAREGVLTEAEFEEFGKPYDLQVLKAVEGAPFNLLHICGPYAYFNAVTDYPVQAINWATIGQHNPTIEEASHRTNKALVGGVDELGTLQSGTPEQVIQEALTAIQVTNGRHLLLTPGCGTNLDVPSENLHALREAATIAATSL